MICLDVGEKRIGVAVTDALDLTAQGVETIFTRGAQRDAQRVLELCGQYETNRVLLGLPRNMDGSEGFQAERVRAFGDLLAQSGLEIRYQDERLTTKLARDALIGADMRRERRKQVIDKVAATYILQTFLDSGGWPEEQQSTIRWEGVWHMSENERSELDMEPANMVVLTDEDGNEVRFEHLMTLEHKGNKYICLVPIDPVEDVGEDEMMIMRIVEGEEDGVDIYTSIEDDDELEEVYAQYLEIAEADDEDEEDDEDEAD